MAQQYVQPTYLDFGFDMYMTRRAVSPQSLTDVLERSIQNGSLGPLSVTDGKVRSISADKITAGTLTAVTNIGNDSVQLDGEDHSIKMYDASSRLQVYIQGT